MKVTAPLLFDCLLALLLGCFASSCNWNQIEAANAEVEKVMSIVDSPPEFEGGLPAFYKYIGKNFKLPATCQESAIWGKVWVEFVVSKEGKLVSPKIIKGLGDQLEDGTLHPAAKAYHEEMLRVFSNSPRWVPGTHEGVARNVRIVLLARIIHRQI
ncbi:energy transducer TonB [Persicobacter sp. CCB-QB2]|uniref:energy transducer TonB n=1 Tax=Persicobacter sp. CCB-QB2 TaxID=1561025 RepID=UPI0006A9DDC8|nr:hypothetical protein [Persicobacter sp. CCB-QB2]